ncbi:MAG TPA: PaaI family thioesterase, partial [Ramlibacter sp.]|nr:PaaI family thioesterase [Ramlibacter sp.]
IGFRVQRKHCNARGLLHGGIVSAVADITLGYATSYAADPPQAQITAHLSVDFLGAAREGDWVEASLESSQLGKRLVFGGCRLRTAEREVARASAVFAVAA